MKDQQAERLDAFVARLEEVKIACIELERDQFAISYETHKQQIEGRMADREDRRRGHQDMQKFELKEFRFMFAAFKMLRKWYTNDNTKQQKFLLFYVKIVSCLASFSGKGSDALEWYPSTAATQSHS